MSTVRKFLSAFALLALLALTFVTPAHAFDGRGGQKVVIEAGEVINDDLYVAANEFVLDGSVKGDLIVVGQTIRINGTVEGDVMAAAQTVIINGKVSDDARIAGAALQLGDQAFIGGDLVAAGASLETRDSSKVGGELVLGSGQALLSGDVAGDVLAGTSSLEMRGNFGGNVQAHVDATGNEQAGPPMSMFITQSPIAIPTVAPGLKISDQARIAGNLEYTSLQDLPIPSGVVGGKITRTPFEVRPETAKALPPTPAQKVWTWAVGLLRSMVTLILFGLFLGWLFPALMKALPEKIRTQPWPSLGWGAITWAAFFFALLVIVVVMIFGGIIFGVLTLHGISGTIIWGGIVALFAMLVGFVLITSYATKVIVGDVIGKWLLARTVPGLADHRFWPMVVGVIVIVLVVGLLHFPLIPLGFFGWLVNFAIILLGLGAIWLRGRDSLGKTAKA